jgi:TonB family protein
MKNFEKKLLVILLGLGPIVSPLAQAQGAGDSPLQIHKSVTPSFPTSLTVDGIADGEVRLAIAVDAGGHLTDMLPLAYTNGALLRSCLAAVRQWTFDAAVVDGEPRGVTTEVLFEFQPQGPVFVSTNDENEFLAEGFDHGSRRFEYQISEFRDLDRIPNPIHIVKPVYAARADKASGPVKVTVDFYIDENGHVRLPYVNRLQDKALSAAVVQAVAQWEFAPPTVKGFPVTVHATQEFVYRP